MHLRALVDDDLLEGLVDGEHPLQAGKRRLAT